MAAFRAHPLDGAVLFFEPRSGTSLRLENEATRHLRRTAPRVVMFGITNACNLRCAYCLRDATRPSAWTVESAADVLAELSAAGTLEVAFGGGEPFAFRGFGELLAEVRRRTPLALHATTNGALLDDAVLGRGLLGEVRLSLHDGPWRTAARRLARAGQRWGANLLVDPRRLAALPSLLLELAALGASDVALLSYVGPDAELHLDAADDERLAAIVRASPLPCRVSICFGRRLDVPRLFDVDCAAGRDFLAIGPDRAVQGCSFQDTSASASILDAWRSETLARPSPRRGCGRGGPSGPQPGLRVWRGFSGNNSGECILVAKFARAEDAQRLLDELAPGFDPGERYSAAWQEHFARERVVCGPNPATSPEEIATLGRTFVAYNGYTLEDFPELRALAWKRGVQVVPGVFGAGNSPVVAVIRGTDRADAEALAGRARDAGALAITHGPRVILAVSSAPDDEGLVAGRFAWLTALAGERPIAGELVFRGVSEDDLTATMKRIRESPAQRSRLVATFRAPSDPFVAENPGAIRAGELVFLEDVVRTKRTAIRALRLGARVAEHDVAELSVTAELHAPRIVQRGRRPPPPPPLGPEDLASALRARLGPLRVPLTCRSDGHGGLTVQARTTAPVELLTAIVAEAKAHGRETRLHAADPDPLATTLRRLLAEVRRI